MLQLTTLLAGAGWAWLLVADPESGRLAVGPSAGLRRADVQVLLSESFSESDFALGPSDAEDLPRRVTLPPSLAKACAVPLAMASRLTDGRRLLGLLLVGAEEFKDRKVSLLGGIAHQVSLRLENASLVEEAALRRSLERELETARSIQESFLPLAPPEVPEWSVSAFWRAAHSVGGDFYDFIPLPAGANGPRWGLAIADVSDKGSPRGALHGAQPHPAAHDRPRRSDPRRRRWHASTLCS